MTLGSTLPWRACSPLGRIQHRLSRPALGTSRLVGHYNLLRAQSTGHGVAKPPASAPPRHDPSTEDAATNASSSLIDRLSRIPVRRHGAWDPVVLKPIDQVPHKREYREGLQRDHRALTQQARLESNRKQLQAGDWRVILQNLIKWSPTHVRMQDGTKVIIPKQSAELLLSDHRNNVWNIKSRTKCSMTLYRQTEDAVEAVGEGEAVVKGGDGGDGASSQREDLDPFIMLRGQPTAISAAVDDILKVTKKVTIVKVQGINQTVLHDGQRSPPSAGAPLSPAVTATTISHYQAPVPSRPYTLNMRADRIPRPKEWTIATFQQYIGALTMARPHGSLGRKLYADGEAHRNTVVRQIFSVFDDPAASAAVSSPAFKLALSYLVRCGETFLKDAQALFDRVTSLGLPMDTEVYNLMAETAVISKNLLAFECTISQMVLHGHKPDLRTWLLFLRIIEAEEVRRYILQAMDTKNFFSHPGAATRVATEMADHDVYRAIQLGQDVDTFVTGLRGLYGPNWRLNTRAANRYLDVFGRYSKFDESKQLLEYMFATERGKPNAVTLNTIITHCKKQNKILLALDFIRMFDEQGCNVADGVTFHLLFECARRTKKPHLLGAIWRYAHMLQMTSGRMRHRGIALLGGADEEVLYMTRRLGRLWEAPNGCSITKAEFFEDLLLVDYTTTLAKKLGRETKTGVDVKAKTTGKQSSPPPHAASHTTSDNTPQRPSSNPAPVEELAQTPSLHPNEQFSSAIPIPKTEDKTIKPDATGGGEQTRAPPLTAAQKYELYAEWAFKKAKKHGPAVPLGEFLQEAIARDLALHRLAHEGGDTLSVQGPALADMFRPVEMPIVMLGRKRFEIGSLPGWLVQKREEEGKREEEKREVVGGVSDAAREEPAEGLLQKPMLANTEPTTEGKENDPDLAPTMATRETTAPTDEQQLPLVESEPAALEKANEEKQPKESVPPSQTTRGAKAHQDFDEDETPTLMSSQATHLPTERGGLVCRKQDEDLNLEDLWGGGLLSASQESEWDGEQARKGMTGGRSVAPGEAEGPRALGKDPRQSQKQMSSQVTPVAKEEEPVGSRHDENGGLDEMLGDLMDSEWSKMQTQQGTREKPVERPDASQQDEQSPQQSPKPMASQATPLVTDQQPMGHQQDKESGPHDVLGDLMRSEWDKLQERRGTTKGPGQSPKRRPSQVRHLAEEENAVHSR